MGKILFGLAMAMCAFPICYVGAQCDLIPQSRSRISLENNTIVHAHIAKTGGSTFNTIAARTFDNVCGNKGNSYEQQAEWKPQQQCKKDKETKKKDQECVALHGNRKWKNEFMSCDLISGESDWKIWSKVRDQARTHLTALVPCREPLDHILSMCNHRRIMITTDPANSTCDKLFDELLHCVFGLSDDWPSNRFDERLLPINGGAWSQAFCFTYNEFNRTIKNLGQVLWPRRRKLSHQKYSTNSPRDMSAEAKFWSCRAWVNDEARKRYDYYRFCANCTDFNEYMERAI